MVKLNEEFLSQSVPPFRLPAYTTPEEARQIFGPDQQRFLSAESVAQAFNPFRRRGIDLPDLVPPSQIIPPCRGLIPYTTVTLGHCSIHQNRRWLLFYSYGQSIAELYRTFGHHNRRDEPGFCPCKACASFKSWLGHDWVTKKGVPGYYLLDLEPRYFGLNHSEQDAGMVKNLGGQFERAPIRLVAEAWFAMQLLTGENPFDFFHWGDGRYPNGLAAIANGNDPKAKHKKNSLVFRVYDSNKGFIHLGLHVIKKPEIKTISSA